MQLKDVLTIFKVDNTRRSKLLQKNIVISFVLTGISLLISFAMYPLLIDYLGVEKYGLWLTISSVSTWMTFFEFGLGSGLKNKLAQSLAHKDMKTGKILVSTTYFTVFIIVVLLFVVLFGVNGVVDWSSLLSNTVVDDDVLRYFIVIMLTSIFGVFLLKILGNVASATQNPYIEKLVNVTMQLLLLGMVCSVTIFGPRGDMALLGTYWCIITIAVWFIFSVSLYATKYREIRPSVRYVRFTKLKNLLSLGVKFFVIQISYIVIHGSTNFMIAKFVGASEVVTYNVAYKLFGLVNIVHTIIVFPTWAAFVDAIEQKDDVWIKRMVRRMLKIWGALTLLMFVILLLSPWIYAIWLGDRVMVPFSLSLILFLYFTTMTFGGIFNMFVNATGKVNTQLWYWSITACLYIVATVWILKTTNLGIYAIAIGLLLSNFYYIALAPREYLKLMNEHEHKN